MSQRRQVFRLSREKRIADIMQAARDVFREKGYEDALVSDIAMRANIVEGSIYRYFSNKRDLLVKVIEDWYETMLSNYDQQLAGIKGTRNRLRFMIWRHLVTVHDEPALSYLMLHYLRSGSDYSRTAVYDLNRKYTRRTLDIIREGIEAGELRPDISLRLVRDMIYGCVEHRTWAYLRGEGEFDPDQTADAIVDLMLSGLQPQDKPGLTVTDASLVQRLERVADQLERLGEQDIAPVTQEQRAVSARAGRGGGS